MQVLQIYNWIANANLFSKPVSPALAGGFLTTGPPGKSHLKVSKNHY